MEPSSIEPRPCTVPDCRGRHEPGEGVALAASLCGARGAQLTTLRRQILELLWKSGRPTGAYELIEALTLKACPTVGPPRIYRALNFLVAQGLASKIESRNAYVACLHPERRQSCLFFLCRSGGASTEVENPRVHRLLARMRRRWGSA